MIQRTLPFATQNALVLATAPLLMLVPYLLTFSPGIGLVSFFLGALLMSVALSSSTRALPLSATQGFNWALGLSTLLIGLLAGMYGNPLVVTIFLVGFGAAHLALTALTRYSARGA
jgi:hypothetical protein